MKNKGRLYLFQACVSVSLYIYMFSCRRRRVQLLTKSTLRHIWEETKASLSTVWSREYYRMIEEATTTSFTNKYRNYNSGFTMFLNACTWNICIHNIYLTILHGNLKFILKCWYTNNGLKISVLGCGFCFVNLNKTAMQFDSSMWIRMCFYKYYIFLCIHHLGWFIDEFESYLRRATNPECN